MSKKFIEWNVNQGMLFPARIADFVSEDHLANFVREVVCEELDLSEILSKYEETRGYPPYNPRMLTALLLYSYTQGIYSSRKIGRSCEERVDYMAICGMEAPNFRTISDFRKRHLESLGGLFTQVLALCREAKILKLGHVSLDGTRIKANASRNKSISYKQIKKEELAIREEVSGWLEKAEALDLREDEEYGKDKRGDELPSWVKDKKERSRRLKEAKESIERKEREKKELREQATKDGSKPPSKHSREEGPSDTKRHNFTDPDSELIRSPQGFIQGYNAQISVDSDSHVIVSCHVSTAGNDIDELKPTIKQIKNNIGVMPRELSADFGYLSDENLKILEDNNIKGYVAVGAVASEYKKIPKPGSRIQKMIQRIKKGGRRTRYRIRKRTVETVFAIIKAQMNFRQFYLRGKESTHQEWNLVCIAYNLRKLALARA